MNKNHRNDALQLILVNLDLKYYLCLLSVNGQCSLFILENFLIHLFL